MLFAKFTPWRAHVSQRTSHAKHYHKAIRHWSHMALAIAFAGWVNSVEYSIWKRKAMSKVLGFMGNKSLHIALSTWQANVKMQQHNRAIIFSARQMAMQK